MTEIEYQQCKDEECTHYTLEEGESPMLDGREPTPLPKSESSKDTPMSDWRDKLNGLSEENTRDGTKPSDTQIGGSHYRKMAIQPSAFINDNGLGWYEGNAVKYICRHNIKGGRQDIEKAIHYLQLLLEQSYQFKTDEPTFDLSGEDDPF